VEGATGSEVRELGKEQNRDAIGIFFNKRNHNIGVYTYDASSIPCGVNEGFP
jgi:hypothetical protein